MRLEAKDVCFGYEKGKLVLNCVNLAMEAGERVALLGPSGCGKSTLSKVLAGYLKPTEGDVLFDGKHLPKNGYCPVQLIHQHPEKAINPRWKLRRTLNEAWTPDDALLKEMGIESAWLNRYPSELSGGELQRFCIARALGPQTRFLIADEISAMLDMITQAQIWEVLLRVVLEREIGLLIVTHSLALAEKVCTKIVKFEDLRF